MKVSIMHFVLRLPVNDKILTPPTDPTEEVMWPYKGRTEEELSTTGFTLGKDR